MENQKFYRYSLEYSNSEQETHITMAWYTILKETKKGYWIWTPGYHFKKWIPKEQNQDNQFAWDTKEKAIAHFIRRTKKRRAWYEYWQEECVKGLAIARIARDQGLTENHKIELSDFSI